MKGRQLVPGRYQSMAELSYVFVADMIRSTAGEDGMKFFALVYSLFMFVLVSNLIGIIPYTFTVASHIIVTAAFALLVFFTVLIFGFYKNGLKFFKIFVPRAFRSTSCRWLSRSKSSPSCRGRSRTASVCSPTCWQVISRSRYSPASSPCLAPSLGAIGWIGGIVPLVLTVALTALELLVAFLQAYVFAVLTCIYLNDALHGGH